MSENNAPLTPTEHSGKKLHRFSSDSGAPTAEARRALQAPLAPVVTLTPASSTHQLNIGEPKPPNGGHEEMAAARSHANPHLGSAN